MKKTLLSLLSLMAATTAWGDVAITEANFPDEAFRQYLLGKEYGKDGIITDEELTSVTQMNDLFGISSLEGIEHFTELKDLRCMMGSLTSLDVSMLTKLEYLYVGVNELTTLNVSNNKELTRLSFRNNQIYSIDLSENHKLELLECSNNDLTWLDISQCPNLYNVGCAGNRLHTIYLSSSVKYLDCQNNELSTLDVSSLSSVSRITCYGNRISGQGMDALVNSLPVTTDGEFIAMTNMDNKNVCTTEQVEIAKSKGWKVTSYIEYEEFINGYSYTDYKYEDYAGSDPNKYNGLYWEEVSGAVIVKGTKPYEGGDIVVPEYVVKTVYDDNGHATTEQLTVVGIDKDAFQGCTGLTSISLPNSIQSNEIGYYAGCSNLRSVKLPDGITSIGRCNSYYPGVFKDCISLTSISLPSSLEEIEDSTFYNCSSLTDITIPNSVKEIGSSAFSGCTSLTMDFPSQATNIGDYAFAGVTFAQTEIELPASMQGLGECVFSNTNVESIRCLMEGISTGSISDCESLKSLYIGKNTGIGVSNGKYWLERIIVEEGNPWLDSRDDCNAIISTSVNFLVFGCGKTVIPESVTSIYYDAFRNCQSLTTIDIPKSVTRIESGAFSGSSLTHIALPYTAFSQKSSYKTVGNFMECIFSNCHQLKSVSLPEGLEYIDWRAFSGCEALEEITFPSTIKKIMSYAFEGCTNIKKVVSLANDVPTSDGHDPFDEEVFQQATLFIPTGSVHYEMTGYKDVFWHKFANTVTMQDLQITAQANMTMKPAVSDNYANIVMDNIYYNLNPDNGDGYDNSNGCLEIISPSSKYDLSFVDGKMLGNPEGIEHFHGIIFRLNAGSGTIDFDTETTGNRLLGVKVGDGNIQAYEQSQRGKLTIEYDLPEPAYVYVFATQGDLLGKGSSATPMESAGVKIYGMESHQTGASNIETIPGCTASSNTISTIYNLQGHQLNEPQKGISIVRMSDGTTRKIVVK